MIEKLIADLNHLSGAFLLIIALGVLSCVAALSSIKRDLACLHEDYDALRHAHEMRRDLRRANRGY